MYERYSKAYIRFWAGMHVLGVGGNEASRVMGSRKIALFLSNVYERTALQTWKVMKRALSSTDVEGRPSASLAPPRSFLDPMILRFPSARVLI